MGSPTTLRRILAVAGIAGALAAPSPARACGSCRGPGGAGSALTAPWQRWGVSLAQTTRFGYGVFDAVNRFRAFRGESFDRVADLAGAVAFRPVSPVELGATTAVGNVLVAGPAFRSSRLALGDLSVRARWEILEEPALELTGQTRRPSLGLTFTARLPTGPVDRASDAGGAGPSPGTVGSTATSQGLGTTELALAADVRKTFASRYQIAAVGEAAWRAPDDALGLRRELGPRGLARLMGIAFAGELTFAGFFDVAAETSVAYAGRLSPRSGQRSVAIGASATLKTELGFRSGVALTFQPPIDGLSSNAVAAAGISTFVAFTK